MIIDINFVGHCDDGSCDLGYAQYICPKCKEYTSDYEELWWQQDEDKGNIVESKCECCKKTNTLKKISYDEYACID